MIKKFQVSFYTLILKLLFVIANEICIFKYQGYVIIMIGYIIIKRYGETCIRLKARLSNVLPTEAYV